ncbi:FtsX-like permease family protein [Ornithinimicrobium cerasi]|uniref:FtsX-like permease family protein n=1 Tax=Ornithinimicrobium cerasi TaxID=2248773 RepID=UPI000EFE908A|nr:FtsX-like permease family protein [Ornithinimicrobium cerasi]
MTTWWGWALRRARASTGLLLTLLALVTVTTAILAGAVGYSSAAATTAARSALTDAPPDQAGIRVQTRQGEDPQAQDVAARSRIDAAFTPAPISVQRTLVSEPRPVTLGGTALPGRLVVLASGSLTPADPGAADRVSLTEGSWPVDATDPVQGMLHAATAGEWEVGVGDTLEVDGTPVAIVGTWRPVDAADAYWFGDRLVAAGADGSDRGPLVVPPSTLTTLVDAPFVRWTVQPDASRIQPDDLARLASAAASLQASLKVPEVDVRGVTVDGDLAPTAAAASTNLATARALGVIPLSVLVLVTMLAVVQLARLLATTRDAQAQLLVARGATRTQVLVGTVGEAALVALLGTALGALAAGLVLRAVPAGDAQGTTVAGVAAVSGLLVLLVLAVVATAQVRRLTGGGTATADLSGRARAATALATVVLVLGAAGVAWWQLRRAGSPVLVRADGSLGTDLLAGAAPALLLAAAAVVAMALLGPAGRLAEALTRPGRAASGHLAAAQVSRRLPVYAVPAVLTVLAVGATTLSGLYAGTAAHLRDNLAAVGQGAPVRAVLVEPPVTTGPGVVPPAPDLLGDTPGVASSVAVWTDPDARLADLTVAVTMAPAAQLADVVTQPDLPDGSGPVVPVAELTGGGPDLTGQGVLLPAGTRTVELTLEAELTVPDEELERLQAGYESLVDQLTGEAEGEVFLGPDAAPLPEEEARATARSMTDEPLRAAGAEAVKDWVVSMTVADPATGLISTVDGAPVEVTRATVEPPQAPRPYTDSAVAAGGGGGTVTFTLPEATGLVVRDLRLRIPVTHDDRFDPVPQDVRLTLTARTDDGTDLLALASGWGSPVAAPPDVVAEAEAEREAQGDPGIRTYVDPRTGHVLTVDDAVYVPPSLDVSATPWVIAGRSNVNLPPSLTVAPGTSYREPVPGSPFAPAPPRGDDEATPGTVPVALTPAAARAANLAVGSPAQIRAFGATLPVTVSAIVPAVPGTLAPLAALVDRDAVAAVLADLDRPLPHPTEVWASTAPGADTDAVVEELTGRADVATVTGPGAVTVTDATTAARLVFRVASAGAVLLAATGIAAVAATLLGARRPEVAVLRALGMPPRAQARSRAVELAGVVSAAVLMGLAAGWLVSRAVVPELARSTTQRAQVALAAPLRLEVGPWVALLTAGAVVVLAVVLVQAVMVARQAVDRDYREEIR